MFINLEFGETQGWWRWMISGMLTTMSHHGTPLGETLSAKITDIRSFTGVGQLMHPKRIGPREGFQTDLALIGSFTGMHSQMQLQRIVIREGFAARMTLVRLRVHGHVFAQILFVSISLTAYITLVTIDLFLR